MIRKNFKIPTNGILGIEVQREGTIAVASAQKLNFIGNVEVTNILGVPTIEILGGVSEFIDLSDVPSAYTGAEGYFVQVNATEDGLDFVDLQSWIEALTDLNLSGVNVTLGVVNGDIVFGLNTTIDWTNTTNTGTQNFSDTYVANYDGSTINIINHATLNIEESTYNSINNTYNYEGDTINYDIDTVINNYGENNFYGITNLYGITNITNIQLPGGGGISAVLTTGDADDYLYARTGYTAYADRDIFLFQPHIANNANPTLNVESLGAKDIVDKDGNGLLAGDLDIDTAYFIMYNIAIDKMVLLGIKSAPAIKTFVMNTNTHNAVSGEYILVIYNIGNATINLPDPSSNEGSQIKIKKFTGEDTRIVTVLPFGSEMVEGGTGMTMNLNGSMATLTCIGGNRYIGD